MNPYTRLGINKYSTEEEIKNAYRKCVLISHPDHGGSIEEFDEVRLAYMRLKNEHIENRILTISMTIKLTMSELVYCLGETQSFMYDDIIMVDVFVPEKTRFGDTIVVKNILPNTTIKIKFKEQHG
tara:strand:- start:4281 stop:4658 length:378 start_codon:yes stop_codon:yes gene_type:complete